MAKYKLEPPLVPRNGRVLHAVGITRISTLKQDERSLDDQEALLKNWAEDRFDGPVEWTFIGGQGSGECIDREQVAETEALVATARYDLVIMEDLSRHMRRIHAVLFCEECEDLDTRLIAINDDIDTCKEWRLHAFFAAMKHEQSNKDTSNRIRRTQRNRFTQGGIFQYPIYGYIKPLGAKNDAEVRKDPDAEPIYDEWFRKLDNGDNYAEIADWLNEQDILTGPYCRADKWDGTMVGRVTKNPILKGLRVRNDRISKRINRTGRRKSVKAPPEDRLERECPHLAFIEPARYDRIIRMLKERNAKYRRNGEDGRDTRRNVPRKRTRYPGQTIDCGICGRLFAFGGHGQRDHLECTGSHGYHCWNGTTVDGPLATEKICDAVFSEIEALESFDPAFLATVEESARQADEQRASRFRDVSAQLVRNERELANVLKFIREDGDSLNVRADLRRLEEEKVQLEYEKTQLERRPVDNIVIPSVEELKLLARESFRELPIDSFEFARHMRVLIPKIVVWPYRLCGGGRIVLRARFRLSLANLLTDHRTREALHSPLERTLSVDLFDPPQREEFREAVVAGRQQVNPVTGRRSRFRDIADQLGITDTAAQHAAALQRKMDELGIVDPYLPVVNPPDNNPKLRRHRHHRYRFEPLDGAGQL